MLFLVGTLLLLFLLKNILHFVACLVFVYKTNDKDKSCSRVGVFIQMFIWNYKTVSNVTCHLPSAKRQHQQWNCQKRCGGDNILWLTRHCFKKYIYFWQEILFQLCLLHILNWFFFFYIRVTEYTVMHVLSKQTQYIETSFQHFPQWKVWLTIIQSEIRVQRVETKAVALLWLKKN